MGRVISENIFFGARSNSRIAAEIEQTYAAFNYQAALLFSERDHPEMARVYHGESESEPNSFAALDRETGGHVVFFACQRPPQAYDDPKVMVGHRTPDREFDDRVVIRSLAGFFELTPEELPAIVVSPNLWRGPVTVIPRIGSMAVAGVVLRQLVAISKQYGGTISSPALCEYLSRGLPTARLVEPNRRGETASVQKTYRHFLNLIDPEVDSYKARRALERTWQRLMDKGHVARGRGSEEEWLKWLELFAKESAFLGLPSMTGLDRVGGQPGIVVPDWYEGVDAVSQQMTLSALHLDRSFRAGAYPIDPVRPDMDHSGLLSGLWKTVEREMNLSFIQLARKHIGIPMPEFFARYKPDVPKEQTIFRFSKGRSEGFQVNRKRKGSAIGGDLEMYMLGGGRELLEALAEDDQSPFGVEFHQKLAAVSTQSDEVIAALLRINQSRRDGSHAQPICSEEYVDQRRLILASPLMHAMNRIKADLRPPEPEEESVQAEVIQFPGLEQLQDATSSKEPSASTPRPRRRSRGASDANPDLALRILEAIGLQRYAGKGQLPIPPALQFSPLEILSQTIDAELRHADRQRRRQSELFEGSQGDVDVRRLRDALAKKLTAQAKINLELVQRLLNPKVPESLDSILGEPARPEREKD